MIRSEYLHPLSWEHHDGLVVGLRLHKGVARNADPDVMKSYLLGFWTDHLEKHFLQEEELLLPHLPDAPELRGKFMGDHQRIRDLVAAVAASGDREVIGRFAAELEQHIRFEERQLFPWLQDHVPPGILEEIGRQLHAEYVPGCSVPPVHFWE